MLPVILISLLLIPIALWYYQYKSISSHLNKIPGPTPIPLLGNVLYFRKTNEILPNVLKLHRKYGGLYKLSVGFYFTLVIADVKFLEYLLPSTKLIEKSVQYKYLYRWLGDGLLTSTGDRWKKHRKILTPAFHFSILEQFTDVFELYSNILVEKLKPRIGKDSFDVFPYITLCSLDIICATSMGTAVKAQENPSAYAHNVEEMCRIVLQRSLNLFKFSDTLYSFTKDYRKEIRAVKFLHDHTFSVIRSRTKSLENNKDANSELTDEIKKKKSLLDLLIGHKKQFQSVTDENIREEVDTFMFEGHDTISTAISFTLYSLATNPDVQNKVMEELVYVFEDDLERPATYKDLQEMKYLENVIKETLRLYPPVPVFARNVSEDVEYDGGIIPKGVMLSIDAYSIHRDPKIYPDPERFDPERFSFENQSKRSPYAYIPFSAGQRNCIGQKFAMIEVKAVVSKILKKYELLPSVPSHKLVLIPELVLKSETGVCFRLQERKI